eukprot:Trichotokara_eunicae@DN4121_c0_g1_i1.p1
MEECQGLCYLLLLRGNDKKKIVKEICERKPPMDLVYQVILDLVSDDKDYFISPGLDWKVSNGGKQVHIFVSSPNESTGWLLPNRGVLAAPLPKQFKLREFFSEVTKSPSYDFEGACKNMSFC